MSGEGSSPSGEHPRSFAASRSPARTGPVRLVLVGAGHSHVEILRRLIEAPDLGVGAAVDLTVVSTPGRHLYSGMVPGYLQGTYSEDEISIDVAGLTRRAGGRFVEARAVGLDPVGRTVALADGGTVAYDLVSVAVGSRSAGADRPEIAAHARPIKPLERVVGLRRRLLELGEQAGGGERSPPAVAVVGAGAAGVELAFAAAAVFKEAGTPARITLIEAGEEILPGYSPRFVARAREDLAARGVEVRTGTLVERVEAGTAVLGGRGGPGSRDGGERLAADEVLWVTGAVALPFLRESGLPVDDRGFLFVDRALRSVGDPRVHAAGDCATLVAHPELAKAGVYAVREAPVLWRSLAAGVGGGDLPRYEPQSSFLALINTGDGRALLRWGRLVAHGRWAWWLKDWIDRRFMRRYQRLTG